MLNITRIQDAKKLREQGLKPKEIAKKMGIKLSTVYYYLWGGGSSSYRKHRLKKHGMNIRDIIRDELRQYGLPLEWEEELIKMWSVYHYSDGHGGRGRVAKLDIQSLIVLLCRRYRVPTPRKLEILTYQGTGRRKEHSGYMDALAVMDGVPVSKPIEYVKYFVEKEDLSSTVIREAQELISKIPKVDLQSKNPRTLAGAILYEIHRPDCPSVNKNRIYTQRYIADTLSITEQSLRSRWIKFFKNQ